MKYVRRLVWYAPDTTDSAASMALRRMSTVSDQLVLYSRANSPTTPPRSYRNVQRCNEVGEDSINEIQSGQDRDNIRAWVSIFLWKDSSKEHCGSLTGSALS